MQKVEYKSINWRISRNDKHDEINRQECLATITNMLHMFKEAEENMTLMRREMNVEKSQVKYMEK